jgi:hypothetical protein
MPPSIVALPPRAGSMKFPEEDVTAVIELLSQCEAGQAVKLTDAADAKENTSRRRAEIMKEQIESRPGDPIRPGYKLRGHVLTAGEPEVKKISGKNYKIFPENWAAVSLVPDTDADEVQPPAEPPTEPEQPPTEPPTEPEQPPTEAPTEASRGRGRRS